MSDKPKSTNLSNWHPATNLNQEVYYAKDIDPFFSAYDKLETELASANEQFKAREEYWLQDNKRIEKQLAEARAEINKKFMEGIKWQEKKMLTENELLKIEIQHRDALMDKCEKAFQSIWDYAAEFCRPHSMREDIQERIKEMLTELKSRREK
jgi:hypothetical protein